MLQTSCQNIGAGKMESEGLKTQKASPAHKPPLAVSAGKENHSGANSAAISGACTPKEVSPIGAAQDGVPLDAVQSMATCRLCNGLLASSLVMGCSHAFCGHCLFQHLNVKPECPTCQVALRAIPVRCLALDGVIKPFVAALPRPQQAAFAIREEEGKSAANKLNKMLWWLQPTSLNPGVPQQQPLQASPLQQQHSFPGNNSQQHHQRRLSGSSAGRPQQHQQQQQRFSGGGLPPKAPAMLPQQQFQPQQQAFPYQGLDMGTAAANMIMQLSGDSAFSESMSSASSIAGLQLQLEQLQMGCGVPGLSQAALPTAASSMASQYSLLLADQLNQQAAHAGTLAAQAQMQYAQMLQAQANAAAQHGQW